MRSEILEKILKETPLETRIKVAIEAFFIHTEGGSFFVPLNEKGEEDEEVMKRNSEIIKKAQPLLNSILKEIEEWRNDGCPNQK